MNKTLFLTGFLVCILYSVASLFIEIPKTFNRIFYGIITIGAIYFAVFHMKMKDGLKERFDENRKKMEEKKAKN